MARALAQFAMPFDLQPIKAIGHRAGAIHDFLRQGSTPPAAVFQRFHIETRAGIAQAIDRDTLDFVRQRKRVFRMAARATSSVDPLLQPLIRQLSSTASTGN